MPSPVSAIKTFFHALVSRELFFCLVIAALFGAHWLAAAPGIMTVDSQSALAQAKEGVYHDQHPPLMAWVWHHLLPLGEGALALFTLHLLLWWGAALALGLTFIRRRRLLAYVFPLLWLTPLFAGIPGAVWKDTGMTASWLLAAALMMKLHSAAKKPGLLWVLGVLVLLLYGTCLRYNALAGAWPLCLWFGWLLSRRGRRPKWAALFASLLLFAGLAGAHYGVSAVLVTKKTYFEQNLFYYDLNCLSSMRETPHFPDYITSNKRFNATEYRRSSPTEASDAALFKLNLHFYSDFYSFKPEQVQALQQVWWNTINAYPNEYASCRLRQFKALTRFGYASSYYPYEIAKSGAPMQPPLKEWAEQAGSQLASYLQSHKNKPYTLPWPYLALAAGVWLWSLLGLLFRARLRAMLLFPAQCLSLSSLMYAASYLVVGIGLDGRFMYWAIASAQVAGAIMIMYVCEWVSSRVAQGRKRG